MLWLWVVLLLAVPARGEQEDRTELAAFQHRLDQYVALHQRLEGPLPALQVSSDMSEVHRLMTALRTKLQASRKNERRGSLLTPGVVTIMRARIAASVTIDDIAETTEAVEEHTPPNMRAVQVNLALPEAAPFGFIPPQVLRALPPLPSELRYLVLSRMLVVWDHHADLVVDVAPLVFDPATYRVRR